MNLFARSKPGFFKTLRQKDVKGFIGSLLLLAVLITTAFSACHSLKSTTFLEICSGLGTKIVAVDADQVPGHDGHHKDKAPMAQTVCPYCAHRTLASALPVLQIFDFQTLEVADSFIIPADHKPAFPKDRYAAIKNRAPPVAC